MAEYLLDTNIALRLADLSSPQNALVTEAVVTLLEQEHTCYLSSQILIELWVVATRPVNVNGLGWTAEQTQDEIERLLESFPLLNDIPQIFAIWWNLVITQDILGKRAHDARIAATMVAYEMSHLLTFNTTDFIRLPGIAVVKPQYVVVDRQGSE